MLLPPNLRERVPEDDLVHFVIEAVDRLPLESFRVNHRGTGAKQFPPHMMLALLIYSFRGFSLRGKEKVSGEWTLVCLAYNLKRLHGMVGSVTNGAGGSKSATMARKPSGISLVSD
jgi:hypothetical protein